MAKSDVWMRFWDKVRIGAGCWEWQGGRDYDGYGQFWHDRRQRKAHQLAYELEVGPILGSLLVLHRCDNPACVRPSHLFLGTHADNMRDKAAKGRCGRPGGARVVDIATTYSRLTPEQRGVRLDADKVRTIRAALANGRSTYSVASDFGVSQNAIMAIKKGITWRHVR